MHWESQVDQISVECSLHRAAAGALIGQMWHISGRWVLFLAYQSSCCCTFGVYFNFLIQKNHGWWCVFLKKREINEVLLEVCFCKSWPWCRLGCSSGRASHLLIGHLVGRPQFVPVYVPNIISGQDRNPELLWCLHWSVNVGLKERGKKWLCEWMNKASCIKRFDCSQ